MRSFIQNIFVAGLFVFGFLFVAQPADATVLTTGYCWNEKVGWIDMSGVDYNAGTRFFSGTATFFEGVYSAGSFASGTIDFTAQGGTSLNVSLDVSQNSNGHFPILGQAFSEQIGWVVANHGGANPAALTESGEITGNFWSNDFGWINCSATDINTTAQTFDLPKEGNVSGGRPYGCGNADALNYDPDVRHRESLCQYAQEDVPDNDTNNVTSDEVAQGENETAALIQENTSLTCPFFIAYHRIGDVGETVTAVQSFFTAEGYYVGPINGVFDQALQDAVVAYQNDNYESILAPWGIPPGGGTGFLYQSTRAHMNVASGCSVCVVLDNGQRIGCEEEPAPAEVTLDVAECPHFIEYYRPGETAEQISKIQIFLRDIGLFQHPEITGYFGPVTETAIRAFQTTYADEILAPWGIDVATGQWYQTTRHKANALAGCPEGALTLDNGILVE